MKQGDAVVAWDSEEPEKKRIGVFWERLEDGDVLIVKSCVEGRFNKYRFDYCVPYSFEALTDMQPKSSYRK